MLLRELWPSEKGKCPAGGLCTRTRHASRFTKMLLLRCPPFLKSEALGSAKLPCLLHCSARVWQFTFRLRGRGKRLLCVDQALKAWRSSHQAVFKPHSRRTEVVPASRDSNSGISITEQGPHHE
ncbi:hypothetical protein DUNSADRAFT_17559 [Dunaliella salina]|nr:hypothetical protein DUNSADRAFT_17559 [Dunaliella salina]|eukprot:KAF5828482.1 hypothetical protein DUNSADRAFT_17559 [Dunaliella salina]